MEPQGSHLKRVASATAFFFAAEFVDEGLFVDAHGFLADEDFVAAQAVQHDPVILFSPHKLKCSLLSDPATPRISCTT